LQNNLAFALLSRNPSDARRALQLVNSALQKRPKHHEFLATRGMIYLRLQRWSDAAADLKAALEAGIDRQDIHAGLAVAYGGVGDAALAARPKAPAEKSAPKKSNRSIEMTPPQGESRK
jgi:uncharacterized protein HemY